MAGPDIPKAYEPGSTEPPWAAGWGGEQLFTPGARAPLRRGGGGAPAPARQGRVFARHPPAQRHRLAPHGAHAGAHPDRHSDSEGGGGGGGGAGVGGGGGGGARRA